MKTKHPDLNLDHLQRQSDPSHLKETFPMKTLPTYLNPESIDLQPSEERSLRPALLASLQRLWWDFVDSLRVVPEPRIREFVDRTGLTYWRVYDPISNEFLRFNTDADVVTWLEERHQRQLPPDRWVW